ncbi:ISAs1 family transposase [Rhabdochlamydiaceae symbiont of Dictyostelium giganteum]|uniref:ISAs1 family transposase n=1 Tax=Rhabdochlamydiaceae symbiont of Dictyostelium giganteum TaxID=3342349 RepID=UPI00385155BA
MASRLTKDADLIKFKQDVDLKQLAVGIKKSFIDAHEHKPLSRTIYPSWFLLYSLLCGYLSDANSVEDLADFIDCRIDWLNTLVQERFSAPSYHTLKWILAHVPPSIFQHILKQWMMYIPEELRSQLSMTPGKQHKGSLGGRVMHLVQLFAAENRLILEHALIHPGAESDILDALMEDVTISKSIIFTGALLTKNSLEKVLQRQANYLILVQDNASPFYQAAQGLFKQAHQQRLTVDGCRVSQNKGSQGSWLREVTLYTELSLTSLKEHWPELKSMAHVKSERNIQGEKRVKTAYYFSSCELTAEEFSDLTRDPEEIDTSLHWALDVIFQEEDFEAQADSMEQSALSIEFNQAIYARWGVDMTDMHWLFDRMQVDLFDPGAGFTASNIAFLKRISMSLIKALDPKRGYTKARRCCRLEPRYLR